MKTIKFYIAAHQDEFSLECAEIADYIRSRNDLFVERKRDIFLDVKLNGIAYKDMHENSESDIVVESSFFYVIMGKEYDSSVRSLFNTALDVFHKNESPKIFTYFKECENEFVDQGVTKFKSYLDKEVKHFYSEFTHVDSIKLDILETICSATGINLRLEFRDGYAYFDDRKVLPLNNIPMYKENKDIQQFLEEIKTYQFIIKMADRDYRAMHLESSLGLMETTKNAYHSAVEKLHILENNICILYSELFELRFDDSNVHEMEKEAACLLNRGNYDAALNVLRNPVLVDGELQAEKTIRFGELIRAIGINNLKQYISLRRTRMRILHTYQPTPEIITELHECYDKNTAAAKKYHIELDCVLDHIRFLISQKQKKEATELCEWLSVCFEQEKDIPEDWKLELEQYLLEPFLYYNEFDKAEWHEKSILENQLLLRNKSSNPAKYDEQIAVSWINLGLIYFNQNRLKEAEQYLTKAVNYYAERYGRGDKTALKDLSEVSINLGNLCYSEERWKEANKYYRLPYMLLTPLYKETKDLDLKALYADICCDLGRLQYKTAYSTQGYSDEAYKLYYLALDIYTELVDANPEKYKPGLARIYEKLADYYNQPAAVYFDEYGTIEKARDFLLKARELYEELTVSDKNTYEPRFGVVCADLARQYRYLGQFPEAEKNFSTAYRIYKKLVSNEPNTNRYNLTLAAICYFFGVLYYRSIRNIEKANKLFSESVAIYEKENVCLDRVETMRERMKQSC